MLLVKNGNILTMAGRELKGGYILADGEKILKIGNNSDEIKSLLSDKNDITVIDAEGRFVLPGFVDPHCHIGLWEDSTGFEGEDGNEDTDPVTPHLRAIDAVNPMDRCFSDALSAGITSVVTGPGSANPIGGQLAALKTGGSRIDDMIIKFPVAVKFALGENPKTVYHGKNQAPVTRMAIAALIRETLFKTQEYLQKKEKAKVDPEAEEPDFDFKLEALLPLIRGETAAHSHAHRSDDVFTAIRIAKEFNLKYVLIHATEGHLIASSLKEENALVVTGPSFGDRSKPELRNMTFETPGVLSKQGLTTAICTDHPVIPENYLMLCAALANREGMDELEAIKAITISAARIAGIDKRVGSLKPGKDADAVIYNRHPFELLSKVEAVFLNGKRVV
jgi:imidazolonepropionase-like amidohydrolase